MLDAKLSLEDVHLPPPDEVTKSFSVVGSRIYSHATPEGGQSFWRFKLDIPLGELEEEIFYSINVRSPCRGLRWSQADLVFSRVETSFRSLFLRWARTCAVRTGLAKVEQQETDVASFLRRGRSLLQRFLGWSRHSCVQRCRSSLARRPALPREGALPRSCRRRVSGAARALIPS